MRRVTLSSLIRWCAIATVAVGIGVLVGKAIPHRSPSAISTPSPFAAEQTPPPAHPAVLRFVKNPEAVPSFSIRSLSGQMLEPSEWKGKVVILNFWATWCTPCRYEIPELTALQKRFKGSLQIVGLSVDEAPPSQVQDFVKQIGFDYPVAMASEKLQDKFGGILALPTSFVINRAGRVVQKHVGLVPVSYYREEIGYLAGKLPNVQVKTFVDEGQIWPSNVRNAKSIPGIDMTHLTTAQRKKALAEMSQTRCTCGCDYTVAQCRLLDPSCPNSKSEARKIVAQLSHGGSVATAAKAKTSPSATL